VNSPIVPRIDVLFDADAIAARVDALAQEIVSDMGLRPFLVSILTGSFMFTADLLRAAHQAGAMPDMGFMGLSSYGSGQHSSGEVKLTYELAADVAGRDILIVDDILDTGRTLDYARNLLHQRGAASIRSCVLLDKKARRVVAAIPDFVGFACPDQFVVGYGLDHDNAFRHLPFIGTLKE
jgi:hypoxanthine phosphoribosyltransferase